MDSKRINSNIHSSVEAKGGEPLRLNSTILSSLFWPTFREMKDLALHRDIERYLHRLSTMLSHLRTAFSHLRTYEREYELLKPARKLYWEKHLGTVDLDLAFGEQVLSFSVSPVHATIIMHFEDRGTLTCLLIFPDIYQ